MLAALALFFSAATFAQTSGSVHSSTSSTTISISDSDHDYSIIAAFGPAKAAGLKDLIINAIGKPTDSAEELTVWNVKNSYNVTLKAKRLIIDLDKDHTDASVIKTFARLGEQLDQVLGAPKKPSPPSKN